MVIVHRGKYNHQHSYSFDCYCAIMKKRKPPVQFRKWATSELSCASFSKRGFVQNFSYENEFYLHVNENSFSYERLCSKTRFEKEVQDNSVMAYGLAICCIRYVYVMLLSNCAESQRQHYHILLTARVSSKS